MYTSESVTYNDIDVVTTVIVIFQWQWPHKHQPFFHQLNSKQNSGSRINQRPVCYNLNVRTRQTIPSVLLFTIQITDIKLIWLNGLCNNRNNLVTTSYCKAITTVKQNDRGGDTKIFPQFQTRKTLAVQTHELDMVILAPDGFWR
jgi:hypothetical protein